MKPADGGGDEVVPGPAGSQAQPQAPAAADEASGRGEQAEPQPFRFPAAGCSVEGEHGHPGEEFAGHGGDLGPDLVQDYAGIDLEHQGLFTGIRGRQIAGRFTLIPAVAFPLSGEWQSLIVTLEQALRLHQHQPGTLAMLDKYLHQRTGGMIGSLSHLIRAGAITAILDGSEAITRDLLDTIPVDHAAQSLRDGAA